MNLNKYRYIAVSTIISGMFLIGLLLLLGNTPQMAYAAPGNLFVTHDGGGNCSQNNPCDLQTALGAAHDGDTLYLAAGTYTGSGGAVVTVTKSITLYGGWDGTTTTPPARDPHIYPTILDGEGARRVVYVSSGITPTIDGFLITRGNATGLGGGFIQITQDAGGGIYSDGATPIIQNNIITNNIASTTSGMRAFGGGIYIKNSATTVPIVRRNQILSNTAGIAIHLGDGGGLFFYGPIQVHANAFHNNVACVSCTGHGGGLEAGWTTSGVSITHNTFTGNRATDGAGMEIVWSAVELKGNTLVGNQANLGGGLYLYYDSGSSLSANRIISNTANFGGGVFVNITLPSFTTLTNNVLARNQATRGGGVYATSDWHIARITMTHNTLADNSEGFLIGRNMTATLVNNIVVSHTVAITLIDPAGRVIADHTLFWANNDDGLRGSAPVDGAPRFVAPTRDDYHIQPNSAAKDAGLNAGVTTDIDGDPRPMGSGYDIGADEQAAHVYLPLVLKAHP